MNGTIDRISVKDGREQNYTFIKGEDGKEYFLHMNSVLNPNEWHEIIGLVTARHVVKVSFEDNKTSKGLRAEACEIIR